MRFRDIGSSREVAAIRLPMPATGLKFTPDGTRLFIMLADKTAVVWDTREPPARQADRDARPAQRSPASKPASAPTAQPAASQPGTSQPAEPQTEP